MFLVFNSMPVSPISIWSKSTTDMMEDLQNSLAITRKYGPPDVGLSAVTIPGINMGL